MRSRIMVTGSSARLVVLSDTHVPKKARSLPDELWQAIDDADVVIHAGDWVNLELLDLIDRRARVLVGVYGNNDGPPLRERLPEVARVEILGLRVDVVHETGQAAGRERRMEARHPEADLLVFGHSHIPWDSVSARVMRLVNPGSPTDRRRQPHGTFVTARVDDGQLQDVCFVPVLRDRPAIEQASNAC